MADVALPAGLFGSGARRRERLLDSFEEAWRTGPPDLRRFVHEQVPAGAADRGETLAELAQIDLEFGIKRGDDARAEDYLGPFPEIAAGAGRAVGLIAAEFRLRSRHGVPPKPAEDVRRFPEFAAALRRRLGGPAASADASNEPAAVVHVVGGPQRGTTIRLEPGRPVVVGRAAGADVRFESDRHLSRFHVRLEAAGSAVRFQDLGSRNGTLFEQPAGDRGRTPAGRCAGVRRIDVRGRHAGRVDAAAAA